MKKVWVVVVLLSFILAGCGKEETASVPEGSYRIFYLAKEEDRIVSEGYNSLWHTGKGLLNELLTQMLSPAKKEHVSAISAAVRLPEINIGADGLVTLMFDESYLGCIGVKEVLMRAAIVKTLCQSEEVDSVEFYVSGQPLMGSQNMPVGIMKAEDFLDAAGPIEENGQSFQAIVYYTNESGNALLSSNLTLFYNSSGSKELAVLQQLISGPTEPGMYPVVSNRLMVRSVTTKDGVCTVDFSERFLEKPKEVSEEAMVYAIVNSLVELPGIQKVQFLIGGEVHKLFQKMDLSLSYERNLNIVENE